MSLIYGMFENPIIPAQGFWNPEIMEHSDTSKFLFHDSIILDYSIIPEFLGQDSTGWNSGICKHSSNSAPCAWILGFYQMQELLLQSYRLQKSGVFRNSVQDSRSRHSTPPKKQKNHIYIYIYIYIRIHRFPFHDSRGGF